MYSDYGWIPNPESFQKICEIVAIWYLDFWINANAGFCGTRQIYINFF